MTLIALIANRVFFKTLPRSVKMSFMTKGHGQLVKRALIANRVFFKTLPRSVKTSFMTKGHGQGVLKRKNY